MSSASSIELPRYEDVAPHEAPWCRDAAKRFFGKTLDEAEAILDVAGTPLDYTDDLGAMGPAGFRFYVQAAVRWTLGPKGAGESDMINGMAGVMNRWRKHEPEELIPCARLLGDFCRSVLADFSRYDASPEIYPGLREKYEELAQYFTGLADQGG